MNTVERMMKEYGAYTDACDTCKVEPPQLKFKCPECDKKVTYPLFTAEKQIELITLIGLECGFEIIPNEGYDYMLSETTFAKYEYNKHGYSMTDFAEALADLTVNLKDKLDNAKVKEILEK